jgi:hypothetical protein
MSEKTIALKVKETEDAIADLVAWTQARRTTSYL